jgi:hypothetical protein
LGDFLPTVAQLELFGYIWQWRVVTSQPWRAYHGAMSGFVSSRQGVNSFNSWIPADLRLKQGQEEEEEEEEESGETEDQDGDNDEGYSE